MTELELAQSMIPALVNAAEVSRASHSVALKAVNANIDANLSIAPELSAEHDATLAAWLEAKSDLRAHARVTGGLVRDERRRITKASSIAECEAMDAAIRPADDGPGLYWHRRREGTSRSVFLRHAKGPTGVPPNMIALSGLVALAADRGVSKAEFAAVLEPKIGIVRMLDDGRYVCDRDSTGWDLLGLG